MTLHGSGRGDAPQQQGFATAAGNGQNAWWLQQSWWQRHQHSIERLSFIASRIAATGALLAVAYASVVAGLYMAARIP